MASFVKYWFASSQTKQTRWLGLVKKRKKISRTPVYVLSFPLEKLGWLLSQFLCNTELADGGGPSLRGGLFSFSGMNNLWGEKKTTIRRIWSLSSSAQLWKAELWKSSASRGSGYSKHPARMWNANLTEEWMLDARLAAGSQSTSNHPILSGKPSFCRSIKRRNFNVKPKESHQLNPGPSFG